ncbi:hypothetical protein RSOLAG22IIIB_08550 [Rhizoctonia solani]|uniref:HAT C-terminal dimerisation domain-containing protein n=1 Tax=Rhizoctonia solani TaxID=456999 RepID=A0A0K6FU10_9AGAM|nr:hypothetical protein RSOLAG22IIIB_08550 [Rhizoctonia solani]
MPHRLWHWDYFTIREKDLPRAARKDYYGQSTIHFNAWCIACLKQRMAELEEQDKKAKIEGRITHVRSEAERRNNAMNSIEPIPSRREGFEPHIRTCRLINPSAKDRLEHDTAALPLASVAALSLSDRRISQNPVTLAGASSGSMSTEDQKRFESDLCKLWIALGIPGTVLITHKRTSFSKTGGPMLDFPIDTNSRVRFSNTRLTVGMSNGWKNIKRNSLLASLLSVHYKTYTVNVHDLSKERKTAANHLNLVLSDIDYMEKEYKVRIIAWVSDAGGDARAMRVNLIVGDILKLSSDLVEAAEQAIDIIKWLLNHSYLLGLFHQEQLRLTKTTHTLTLPVIVRWTSHFLSFASLISESRTLRSLLVTHPEAFRVGVGRSAEQEQQVQRVMRSIEDVDFWCKLAELKVYLEPLAIAANVAQAPTTRLDHILIELGRLYYTFSRFPMNSAVMACILNSLGLRWGKSDQDPAIVAVVLNPYIRIGVFSRRNPLLNSTSLYGAAKRVFRRLFRKDNELGMHDAFMDYLDGRNEFHPDRWDFQELRASYEQSNQPVDLIRVWSGLLLPDLGNFGRQQLVHLAINVLSIVANSAGCERLFSEMGYIQSQRRARLSNQKTFDTAVVRMESKRTHAAAGLTRARLRRQFGLSTTKQEATPSLPDSEIFDQHDETAEELAEIDIDEESPTCGIKELANQLAQDVIDDQDPPDSEDDADDVPVPGGTPSTVSGPQPKRVRLFFGTQYPITLKDLFNYDAPDLEGQGLNIFKNAGLSSLQKELEAYDLLTRERQKPDMMDGSDD